MKLIKYLHQKNMRAGKFAQLVGRSDATISRIKHGICRPDWKTMDAILKATRGAVKPNDFMDMK